MSTILVTGGNRGIGFAIVQQVIHRLPTSRVILGCRDVKLGVEAIKQLRDEGITADLEVVEIDIEDDASITAAVTTIDRKYGKLDGKSLQSQVYDQKKTSNSLSLNQQCH